MATDQVKRPMIAAKITGPGAGRYMLPPTIGYIGHDFTRFKHPAYSFGIRLVCKMFEAMKHSPGPIYFVEPQYTRFGKDGTPKYTMLARPHDLESFKTPGPGAYNNELCHPQGERNAPKYSMASRTRYRRCDSNPAPNTYTLPSMLGSHVIGKESSASYSMTGRPDTGRFDEDLAKAPGAATYRIVDPNIYKYQAPIYSMLARRFMPGDKTKKPGPGAHYPELVTANKPKPPEYSMGIRHSEFITPLITEEELEDFW